MTGTVGQAIRVYSADELRALPRPKWLIEGVMEEGGLTFLIGAPRSGKTFVALDWAGHVVTGKEWHGKTVQQGHVLYVASEGGHGIRQRLDAYEQFHSVSLTGSFFVLQGVPLLDTDAMNHFTALVAIQHPGVRLIVIDTFARCFGGDENSAQETGKAIAALDNLRQKTKATILVVHHTVKAGDSYRGSSALEGAADTMVSVVPAGGGRFRLENDKQKNAAEFEGCSFRLQEVQLAPDADVPCSSCVVVGETTAEDSMAAGPQKALEVLTGHYGDTKKGLATGKWRELTGKSLQRDVPDGTFRHWREKLEKLDAVASVGNVWVPESAIAVNLPIVGGSMPAIPSSAANTTPLLVGGGGGQEARQERWLSPVFSGRPQGLERIEASDGL